MRLTAGLQEVQGKLLDYEPDGRNPIYTIDFSYLDRLPTDIDESIRLAWHLKHFAEVIGLVGGLVTDHLLMALMFLVLRSDEVSAYERLALHLVSYGFDVYDGTEVFLVYEPEG